MIIIKILLDFAKFGIEIPKLPFFKIPGE